MAITKGFIKDWHGNRILPITRAELVLDQDGKMAFTSKYFEAGYNGNEYGLISAAERALISGGGDGQGITDIYNKLDNINNGLYFNDTLVNFYASDGTATPIKIGSAGDGKITIGLGTGNAINLSLAELTTTGLTASQIVKSITVDKYGRVTAVSGSALTNAEIPEELSGKTISGSTLSGCTTADVEIGTDAKSVANKSYVDKKFQEVTGIATGALKFGGSLSDATSANNALNDSNLWNSYFKVTKEFAINTADLFDKTGIAGDTLTVKTGDTIIIYPPTASVATAKFVYVPSGDDITTLTVKGDSSTTNALTSALGSVYLRFSNIFSVTNSAANTAYISIPIASATQDGYLTKEDYAAFKSYASALKVEYTGEFSSGAGVYKIGTLKIGTSDTAIYGKNNISALTLENGTGSGDSAVYNPILKFTETGVTDVKITVKGVNGIVTRKNADAIEIAANNEVATDSTKYLEIESGYKFKARIGSVVSNQINHGLTDYEEFATFRSEVVTSTTVFELIENSLNDTAHDYYYGSTDLKAAVTLTI